MFLSSSSSLDNVGSLKLVILQSS